MPSGGSLGCRRDVGNRVTLSREIADVLHNERKGKEDDSKVFACKSRLT